jgi:uncharacterized protein YbjT (DUF2867 family)
VANFGGALELHFVRSPSFAVSVRSPPPLIFMNILIFGATGMVGQGVLRECLLAPEVARVTTVGRTPVGQAHERLRDIVQADLTNLSLLAPQFADVDACFFCLGVSAVGLTEEAYTRLTYDLTLSIAQTLARANPRMTFVYVSGMGTDSSERGRTMWARVKGRTENALLRAGFDRAFMFRPGIIIPMHGIVSKTAVYRIIYAVMTPLYPLLKRAMPKAITSTEQVGRAMLAVARRGYATPILEAADINSL